MFVEDFDDFFDSSEMADEVTFTEAAYADDHPTSNKTIKIKGNFENSFADLGNVQGLLPTFLTPSNKFEVGARMTHTDINGVETDYLLRENNPDGTGLYLWIMEKL